MDVVVVAEQAASARTLKLQDGLRIPDLKTPRLGLGLTIARGRTLMRLQ